jgi:hypothetical protein
MLTDWDPKDLEKANRPVLAMMATMHPLGFQVLIALIPTTRRVSRKAASPGLT